MKTTLIYLLTSTSLLILFAKQLISSITFLANKINNDVEVNKYIKVVFIENYDVTKAEIIIPSTDISEQISLAGKEASGTGNMKFMMNGALTLGTLDGANVEIADLVGNDNIFIFGLKADEVKQIKDRNEYSAFSKYYNDPTLNKIISSLTNCTWHANPNEFRQIIDELLVKNDEYLLLEDFYSYVDAHKKANDIYQNRHMWARMAMINIASSAYFSSDRTIQEYIDDIWKLEKVYK